MVIGVNGLNQEYLPFTQNVVCDGRPEDWLQKISNAIRNAVRAIITEALTTQREMTTEQWALRYPLQIVLCAARVMYCEEVSRALDQMQSGSGSAASAAGEAALDQILSKLDDDVVSLSGCMLSAVLNDGEVMKIESFLTMVLSLRYAPLIAISYCDVSFSRSSRCRETHRKLLQALTEDKHVSAWRGQVRLGWSSTDQTVYSECMHVRMPYGNEYLGNFQRAAVGGAVSEAYIRQNVSCLLFLFNDLRCTLCGTCSPVSP